MSGIKSSGDGAEELSLEEYIRKTDRDHENEVRKSIRLWEWQDGEITWVIGVELNTNSAEIVNRAYSIGLRKLRDDIGDDIQEVNKMVSEFMKAIKNLDKDSYEESRTEVRHDVISFEVGLDDNFGNLTDNRKYPLRRSELSEVRDTYSDKGPFGGWIHRVIIALGLKESEYANGDVLEIINSVQAYLGDSVEDSREYLESRMKNFVGKNIGDWMINGISDNAVDRLYNTTEYMATENSTQMEKMIDTVSEV